VDKTAAPCPFKLPNHPAKLGYLLSGRTRRTLIAGMNQGTKSAVEELLDAESLLPTTDDPVRDAVAQAGLRARWNWTALLQEEALLQRKLNSAQGATSANESEPSESDRHLRGCQARTKGVKLLTDVLGAWHQKRCSERAASDGRIGRVSGSATDLR